MAKLITDALKELYTAQGVIAEGDTIADVLKDGNEKAYSATVDGNLIADVISQTAETGTFPGGGGGAAPTVVNEITWDGDTAGLDTFLVDGEVPFYKVSDGILPFGALIGGEGGIEPAYNYLVRDYTSTELRLDAGLALNGIFYGSYKKGVGESAEEPYMFLCAFADNVKLQAGESEVTIPKAGTWFSLADDLYIASITATGAE